jgi:hypothetical protein
MRRWCAVLILMASTCGCGGDDDDVAEVKKPLPMDQVPAPVMKAAKEAAPGLTFFAAYTGKFGGKDSIELKGKTKSGQIKELEVSPEGKVLGSD